MNGKSKIDLVTCLPAFRLCWEILETYKLDRLLHNAETFALDHARRTSYLALRLGMRLGLREERLRFLGVAALIHDIGKIIIPEAILRRCGPLTREEKEAIMTHPATGAALIERSPVLRAVVPGVLYHHCWYNNHQKDCFKGYPRGISGDDIPMDARIIAVADAFDAMTSERPYRTALPLDEAARKLAAGAGEQFDPAVVEAFVPMVGTRPDDAAEGIGNLRIPC